MCKLNKHNDGRRIDPCILTLIKNLNAMGAELKASCCGHGKYPMSLIVGLLGGNYDIVSGKYILRKKRFYKKDKQGYYYIPEAINEQRRD